MGCKDLGIKIRAWWQQLTFELVYRIKTKMATSSVIVLIGRDSRKLIILWKELSFCHKLWFSNSYNLTTRFPRPLIFQTINSVRTNSLSLKYQRFTTVGCLDVGVRKYEFVAKQFDKINHIYLVFQRLGMLRLWGMITPQGSENI